MQLQLLLQPQAPPGKVLREYLYPEFSLIFVQATNEYSLMVTTRVR